MILAVAFIVLSLLGLYVATYHPHWLEWMPHPERKKTPVRTLNPSGALDPEDLGKHFHVLTKDGEGAPRVQLSEISRYKQMQLVGATGTGKNRYGIYPMSYQDIRHDAGLGWKIAREGGYLEDVK